MLSVLSNFLGPRSHVVGSLPRRFFPPNSVPTLRVLTVLGKAWFRFRVTAQKILDLPFLMEVSHETWSWRPFFGRCTFTAAPCLFLDLSQFSWQAWRFRNVFRSRMSFRVTGAGHRTLFHPCGRRGAFSTLLKRWQAWVEMRGAFGDHRGRRSDL